VPDINPIYKGIAGFLFQGYWTVSCQSDSLLAFHVADHFVNCATFAERIISGVLHVRAGNRFSGD
jgi:hypothetical protein